MASVRPTSRPAVHDPSRQAKSAAASTHVVKAASATMRTTCCSSRCSRLARGCSNASDPPMRPSAVRAPWR
jgi:hypothetical protein